MDYRIDILNPMDQPGWDEWLVEQNEWTFFHTSAWARVLCETYRYRPVYFAIRDKEKRLAMIPMMEVISALTGRRGVSLPFTDYCGPIIAEDCRIEDLHNFIKDYGRQRRWKSIEYRGECLPDATAVTSFYRHTLDLTPDVDRLLSAFKATTRRNIKKAIREGIEVGIETSARAVDEYYRLHCMTRKKHGVPPQPQSFFRKIHEHIISQGLGVVVLARYKGVNVAGDVFFGLQGKALYKFGASDYGYQQYRPSDLVMWEGIKWYAENGYHTLCFGRTDMDNDGLRRFKSQWGTREQIVNYYRYSLRQGSFVPAVSGVDASHHCVLTGMPVWLLRLLGRMLYKHMG